MGDTSVLWQQMPKGTCVPSHIGKSLARFLAVLRESCEAAAHKSLFIRMVRKNDPHRYLLYAFYLVALVGIQECFTRLVRNTPVLSE